MSEERFMIEVLDKNNWLIEDTKTGETANPVDGTTNVLKGLVSTLNKFNNDNEQLKERNDRQAKQLDELYSLIEQEDWQTLKGIIQEFKECEEQLQREWRCYE